MNIGLALKQIIFHLDAVRPIPSDFHTCYKYENNTSPCGRWHAMFSQALLKARGA